MTRVQTALFGITWHELAFHWRLGKVLAIVYMETDRNEHLCITMSEQEYRENRRLIEGLDHDDELTRSRYPLRHALLEIDSRYILASNSYEPQINLLQ